MTKPPNPPSPVRRKAPQASTPGSLSAGGDLAAPQSRRTADRNAVPGGSKSYPKAAESRTTNPPSFGARISRRAADRLRSGHLWVYASDIESLEAGNAQDPPALLPVADNRGL